MRSALIEIGRAWLDPSYALRKEAVEKAASEFCLSTPSFELALDWIFSQWTETNINAAIQQNPYPACQYAAQILAGNTPAVIAQGFFQGAILNTQQCIKLPRQQSIFANILYQSIAEHSAELASIFEVSTWQDNLAEFYTRLEKADLVFAYGNDETIAMLKEYIRPHATFVAHGHAESAAVIFNDSTRYDTLEALAYDMLSYDQRGCLSPRITFIEAGGALSPEACTKLFAEDILPTVAAKYPRGSLFPGEAVEILHQRSVYGFNGSVYSGTDWTVCYTNKTTFPMASPPRFMPVAAFQSIDELIAILNPIQSQLISLGCEGNAAKLSELKKAIKTRYCRIGEMQKQLLVF